MALPFFAVTLFVSAFQLFLVQPMIGQMILPKLGGTPQVWNTCMVFFQSALLAGYAYTHTVSTNLTLRKQILVHGALLLVPLAVMLPSPFDVRTWVPTPGANPIGETLLLLTLVVGLPFFVVATSAPLLQKWFGATGHAAAKDPYFLYGASNFGSMLSLIAYPFLVEPYLPLRTQAMVWVVGYFVLIAMFVGCAIMVWRSPASLQLAPAGDVPMPNEPVPPPPPGPATQISEAIASAPQAPTAPPPKPAAQAVTAKFGKKKQKTVKMQGPALQLPEKTKPTWVEPPPSDELTVWRRIRWVLLAACPTSLMLGVSSYISTDISAIPLFWILPLALYLLSFILVFLRWPIPWTRGPHSFMVLIHPIFVMVMAYIVILLGQVSPIERSIMLSLLAFFLTAMVCHGELARDRPGTAHLTEFYLWMAFGGMLGGMFNGLFAPILFTGIVEYPLALILGCVLRPVNRYLAPIPQNMGVGMGVLFGFLLGMSFPNNAWTISLVPLLLGALGAAAGGILGYLYQPPAKEHSWTDEFLINTFPGLGDWARQTSQDLAARFGKTVKPGSIFVLSYSLDILLGLFMALFMWVLMVSRHGGWLDDENIFKILNYVFSKELSLQLYGGIGTLLLYGVPAVICFFYAARPLRFGLALGAIMLIHALHTDRAGRADTRVLEAVRSYFGALRVYETDEMLVSTAQDGTKHRIKNSTHTYLMHGTTHHGLNYRFPRDLSRLATTYYHQHGPAGVVMEKYNWFQDRPKYYMQGRANDEGEFTPKLVYDPKDDDPDAHHTYKVSLENDKKRGRLQDYYCYRRSDARMPANLAALGFDTTSMLVGLWSEPPYATIGLGTGTMASYGRPFQHVHYYEIDNHIRRFSLPTDDSEPHFSYLKQAMKRGSFLQVLMGDARLRMARPYKTYSEQDELDNKGEGGGPDYFYHMMVVDAFSSDAIPRHLITVEALEMYFTKLAPGGILCVHTSNRHVDLVPVVANAASHAEFYEFDSATGRFKVDDNGNRVKKKGLVSMRAHDSSPFLYDVNGYIPRRIREAGRNNGGHYTSEWVMVARSWEDLKGKANSSWKGLQAPPGYADAIKASHANRFPANADPKKVSERVEEAYEPYWQELLIADGVLQPYGSKDAIFDWQQRRGNFLVGRPWTDDFSNVVRALRRH